MAKREYTEEEKREMAERLKKGKEAKKAEREAQAEVPTTAQQQPIIQVVAPQVPEVKILYVDSVIQNNQIPIGAGRFITGSGRIFTKTLTEFEGEFMTPLTMKLINKRKFIVLSGLNEEQRQQYNCDYKDGEVIKSEGTFDYLLKCSVAEATEIFKALCFEHRELVGTRFIQAYENRDNRITRDRVEALNEISKNDYEDGKGIFTEILIDINKM